MTHISLVVTNALRYCLAVAIRGFRDNLTERIFDGSYVKQIGRDVQRAAHRKLKMIDFAGDLRDLRVPPGNRLEALRGDRKGQHSIRVNDQYRICFVWTATGPDRVELTDYH